MLEDRQDLPEDTEEQGSNTFDLTPTTRASIFEDVDRSTVPYLQISTYRFGINGPQVTTNYAREFEMVDIAINSTARTVGVDAFARSLIKGERQIQKLVTDLIHPLRRFSLVFGCGWVADLTAAHRTLPY